MRIAELMTAVAAWLEDPNNEMMLLSEYDEDCLKVVAASCLEAAETLKKAASDIEVLEPVEESNLTESSLNELAELATAFDASDDENLKKQASVIDELLLTIASPPDALGMRKDLLENRIEELKKKYNLKQHDKVLKTKSQVEKMEVMKEYKIQEHPLSTRTCTEHPGAQMGRVGEYRYQCSLDGKIYDYTEGYTLLNGDKVPGGDVANQTKGFNKNIENSNYDSRAGRLGLSKL
jgi:hypothetical protein